MKRTHHNRIPINYWWGFVTGTRDLVFYLNDKTVVFMTFGGTWIVRSL